MDAFIQDDLYAANAICMEITCMAPVDLLAMDPSKQSNQTILLGAGLTYHNLDQLQGTRLFDFLKQSTSILVVISDNKILIVF